MRRGAPVLFRSLDGNVLDGVLTSDVRANGTVAVDVQIPGCPEPLSLSKVMWQEKATATGYTAWPK